jgi:hypothetical protein
VQDDPGRKARVQDYLQRRAKTPDRAEDQQKLALWREQNSLKDQAIAHFHQAIRPDPSREVAWKLLGYKKVGGRWQKPEVAQAQKHENELQAHANKHWKPLMERWRDGLATKDKSRRASAEKGLSEPTDPRAVPAVWATFATGAAERQGIAVRLLGQIDSPGSSRALAILALRSHSADVRRNATEVLRRRDARDFAPLLIALLRDPIKYEMKKARGPGSQGELLVKNKDMNVKRLYTPLAPPQVALLPNDYLTLDANGRPVISRMLGLAATGWFLDGTPTAGQLNVPVTPTQAASVFMRAGLSASVSQKLGTQFAQSFSSRFIDLGGSPRGWPVENVLYTQQLAIPIGQMMLDAQISALVAQQQFAGDVKGIDDYNVGVEANNGNVRQVLTDSLGFDAGQDRKAWQNWMIDLFGFAAAPPTSSSETPTIVEQVPLAYQPQVAPSIIDQPLETLMWRHSCFAAGTLVRSISEDKKQRVFNLQVADGESFFVGSLGVLAHDNSLINPVPEPFDAVNIGTKPTHP